MTAHKIFDGAFVMYSDMHLKECRLDWLGRRVSSLVDVGHCWGRWVEVESGKGE